MATSSDPSTSDTGRSALLTLAPARGEDELQAGARRLGCRRIRVAGSLLLAAGLLDLLVPDGSGLTGQALGIRTTCLAVGLAVTLAAFCERFERWHVAMAATLVGTSVVFALAGMARPGPVETAAVLLWIAGVAFAVGAAANRGLRTEAFRASRALAAEQARADLLLRNMFPPDIVDRLARSPEAIADGFADASILFVDIVDFTPLSERLQPAEVVALLDDLFSRFDHLTEELGLEKIKTVGDAYMVAGGLPEPQPDHATRVARLALRIRELVRSYRTATGEGLAARMGINSGPVVAGVIGRKRPAYDLWGDAVNTASRMESHAGPDEIQVSRRTYETLAGDFVLRRRGVIDVKGKGPMETYLLVGERARRLPNSGRQAVGAARE